MFNKAILKNFVAKQLEKKAAEEAKQQAMQQQAMPPQQQMMPPQQQQQIPMAQAGVSVTEDPPEKLVRGFNPNAGVDNNFIESFVTNVTTPGAGGNWIQYQDQSDEGEIKHQLPSDRHYIDPHTWTHADLKNATRVKFQGNIGEKENLLRKLNRQNFWGAHGFRGKGWKTGLTDEEIKQFKEEQPFFQPGRVRDVEYNLLSPDDPKQYVDYSTREDGGELPKAQFGWMGDAYDYVSEGLSSAYDTTVDYLSGNQGYVPDAIQPVADYAAYLGEGIYNKGTDWLSRQYNDAADYFSGNQGLVPDRLQNSIDRDITSGSYSNFMTAVLDPTGLGREVIADVKDYMNPHNYEIDEETGYYSILPEYYPQEFETLDDAFAQARRDLGPGKEFLYNHVRYKTDYYGESESKSTNEILNRLKRGVSKGEITENEYARFVNLWNQVGQPDLSVHSDERPLRLGLSAKAPYLNTNWADATLAFSDSRYDAYRRDHVNPFTKALHIPGKNLGMDSDAKSIIKRLTNELAHSHQLQQMGTAPFTSKIIGDEIRSFMIMEPDKKDAYKRPGTLEYEAHEVLEPKFTDFVFKGDAKVSKAPLDLRQQGGTSGSYVEPDDSRKQSLVGMAGKFFDQNGNLNTSPFEVVQFFADQGASSEEIWGLFRHFNQDSNSDLVQRMIGTYTGKHPNTYTQYAKTGGRVLKLKRK